MPFTRQDNVTVTGVGDVSITFFIPEQGSGGVQSGEIEIQLLLSNGKIRVVSANLIDRLMDDSNGDTHLANLISMRDYLKSRITAEVLPIP